MRPLSYIRKCRLRVGKMRQSYTLYEKWERALFLRVAVLWGGAPAYGEVVMLCSVGLQLLQEVGARYAAVASVLRSSVVVFLDSVRGGLKGQCHEIFCFRFFHESSSPKPPKITLGSLRFFSKNSQVKVHHRYRWHRRQILPPVPMVLLTSVENLPPVSTITTANLPPGSITPVALSL